MTHYFTHSFQAPIARHGVGKDRIVWYKVLFLPPKLEADLPFETWPRLRVEGEIAEVPVRGAWMPVGDGRRYFIVSPEVRAATGLDLGDEVDMRFRVDDQDHVDVPPPHLAAIRTDAQISDLWNDLTAGKKRMFSHHVGTAKTPPTEQRRIDEALSAIRQGVTIRDLKK